LLPALLALALATPLTPAATAQEVPAPGTGETVPAAEQPGDPGAQPETPPVAVDPPPQPEPQPQPEVPPPPPEAQQPADTPPVAPVAEHPQAVPDRGGDTGSRDTASPSASSSPQPVTTFTAAPQAPATQVLPPGEAPATTAPLGWDIYDDTLFAETLDDNGNGGAGAVGDGVPPVFGTLGALGAIGSAVEHDKRHDARPASRAEPMSGGGSGPGGSGPGQGPSLGLFGAAGGSGAGMALLTLLGMACGWLLLAPAPKRAFLTPTATWRPSAYVPPIEHPG
jgi:hypothetical protein